MDDMEYQFRRCYINSSNDDDCNSEDDNIDEGVKDDVNLFAKYRSHYDEDDDVIIEDMYYAYDNLDLC